MPRPNLKNLLIALLAATTVAGGVLAWSQYQDLVKLRADRLSDTARADLQKRLWALEKQKKDLQDELARLRAHPPGPEMAGMDPDSPSPDGGPGGPPGRRFDPRARLNNLVTLLDNPEFNKLWTGQQKAMLDGRFSALFKNLNLSGADLDRLKSLLVEKQNANIDVLSAAREQGLNPRNPSDRAEIGNLMQTAEAQVDSNIRQLLGDGQYSQYQNYEQTIPQRSLVNQLSQTLSYSGSPLQDAQAEQLVSILAANSPARQASDGPGLFAGMNMGGPVGNYLMNRAAPITDAAITQASSVLSATQVTALQQMQAQQQAQQELARMMHQSGRGGGGTAPATQGASTSTTPAAPKPSGG
jgi:hypothetical protein